MWNTYLTSNSLDEVLQLLARYGQDACIVAGGTDLIIELERKQKHGDVLIDITRVSELSQIKQQADGSIEIGALVTHNRLASSDTVTEHAFPLAQAAFSVGAPQIRNRGTLGGNLVTASPANDTIAPLWAMGAQVKLVSVRGERLVPIKDFYLGVRQVTMDPDEILASVIIPPSLPGTRGVFLKLGLRKAQAISVVNLAAVVHWNGSVVEWARIVSGCVGPTMIEADTAADSLRKTRVTDEDIELAARYAGEASSPIDDIRAPADYRADMVRVLTRRALTSLRDGTERKNWMHDHPNLWGKSDGVFRRSNGDKQSIHERNGDQPIQVKVNGSKTTVMGANHKTLLQMLRDDLGLLGTKEGCGEGECGACTVLLDDMAVMSCLVPAPQANGCAIITVEGLAEGDQLSSIQSAFVDHGAVQCGYCTPGFLMSAHSLLQEIPNPDRTQIQLAFTGNLCRCTGYAKIINAVEEAREELNG